MVIITHIYATFDFFCGGWESLSWDALQVAQDHLQSAKQWEEDTQGKGEVRGGADDARDAVG